MCGVAYVIYCATSLQLHEANKWTSFLAVYKRFFPNVEGFRDFEGLGCIPLRTWQIAMYSSLH